MMNFSLCPCSADVAAALREAVTRNAESIRLVLREPLDSDNWISSSVDGAVGDVVPPLVMDVTISTQNSGDAININTNRRLFAAFVVVADSMRTQVMAPCVAGARPRSDGCCDHDDDDEDATRHAVVADDCGRCVVVADSAAQLRQFVATIMTTTKAAAYDEALVVAAATDSAASELGARVIDAAAAAVNLVSMGRLAGVEKDTTSTSKGPKFVVVPMSAGGEHCFAQVSLA